MRLLFPLSLVVLFVLPVLQADEIPAKPDAAPVPTPETNAPDAGQPQITSQPPAAVPTPEASTPASDTVKPSSAPAIMVSKQFKITKVHDIKNDETYEYGRNRSLEFEQEYWNYGAVTAKDKADRRGQYFVISWANHGPPEDIVARFEYRQVKSKDKVRVLEVAHPQVKGGARSTFSVLGDAYIAYGPVYSWRFTLMRGGEVVAEEKSFIW